MTTDLVLIAGEKNTTGIFPEVILCIMKVRNEILRIRSVLDHHRMLGIDRFFIVDNGSEDGTVEFLEGQPDVALFVAHKDYKVSHAGLDWVHSILDTFCEGRWSLIVDADELFIYPHFEDHSLGTLCKFLDKFDHKAMLAIMVDMYSKAPIAETVHQQMVSLLDECKYFDPGPYDIYPSPDFPFIKIRGGPRRRCFWDSSANGRPPALSKVPLINWQRGYRYISSTHTMSPAPARETIPEICGALLHFKFLNDFHHRAKIETDREQRYANAIQYKQYLKKMDENPTMNLYYGGSIEYRNSKTLIEHRLIRSVTEWDKICSRSNVLGDRRHPRCASTEQDH